MTETRKLSLAAKPLPGKRIVLTRAAEQVTEFDKALTDAGANVVLLPCIEFAAPTDWTSLDAALSVLSSFDWLVFTSQNAVHFFNKRKREVTGGRLVNSSGPPKISALGNATAQAATKAGLPADFVATSARSGTEFVSEFAPLARGKSILLPQSDQAGDRIPGALRDAGAIVTSVVAYRTCMPESLDHAALARIQRDGADMIFFGSPSAFRNFALLVGEDTMKQLARNSAFGAIGPTTASALRDSGIAVDFESPEPSSGAIVNAMAKYFAEKERTKLRS